MNCKHLSQTPWAFMSRNHILMKPDPGYKAHLPHALTWGLQELWDCWMNSASLQATELPGARRPYSERDQRWPGRGVINNCQLIFKVSGSGMEPGLLWISPLPALPTLCHPRTLFFHPLNFPLGSLKPTFPLSFPSPPLQKAGGCRPGNT